MAKEKSSVVTYVHYVIGIALMCLGNFIPAQAPLTPMGAKVLMIFVGMIYLWCTSNAIAGSLLALFAVSVAGYAPFTTVLSNSISEVNFLIVFYACILFQSAIVSGMPRYLAHGIFKMTSGIVTGRPMVLLFILMLAAAILSALTSIIPCILMFWAISYAVIDELGLEKHEGYSMMLVFGTFMGAMLGNSILPFKGATLIIISAFEKAAEVSVPYGPYMIINVLCALLIMVLYCLMVKYIFRIDLSKVKNISGEMLTREQLPPMSTSVKAHIFTTIAFIVLVMVSTSLSKAIPVIAYLNTLGTQGFAVLLIILLLIIQDDGKPCLKMGLVMKEIPWAPVFMVMTCVYMAGVLKDKDACGVIPWLKMILNPVLGGHSEFVFAALIFVVAMVLTCFFHNGALGNMLMPVLFAIASANSYNSVAIAAIMTMAINMAFLMPSASNYAPMIHGNREYVTVKDIWTYGLVFELLTFAIFLVVGFPMAKFMM